MPNAAVPRASCDECFHRKLKCAQGPPNPCERCLRLAIQCTYSPRKPMGRPRKRRREDAAGFTPLSGVDPLTSWEESGVAIENTSDARSQLSMVVNSVDSNEADLAQLQDITNASNIDPALDALHVNHVPPESPSGFCSCLPNYYLAAADLPAASTRGFPAALPPLKAALKTAARMLHCTICLSEITSGRQNVMLLIALLGTIASGFHKLLCSVDMDADRARVQGTTMLLHTGDTSHRNAHRHTGDANCPARFDLELSSDEWRLLVRRMVVKEVFEDQGGAQSLQGLVSGVEQRMGRWHASRVVAAEYGVREPDFAGDQECPIIKLANALRDQIARLPA